MSLCFRLSNIIKTGKRSLDALYERWVGPIIVVGGGNGPPSC